MPRRLSRGAVLATLMGLSAVAILAWRARPQQALPPGVVVDRIVIVKHRHEMTMYSHGIAVGRYRVSLGRSSGAKRYQGDHRTPLGDYIIDAKNAHSRFHLSLHVSYPNAIDRARAARKGRPPGNNIMIHGVEPRFAWLGPITTWVDWTDGCIAVTNTQMDRIWRAVPLRTPVQIER